MNRGCILARPRYVSDMKTPQDIFDEIPPLQRKGLDPDQITEELERSAMDTEETRLVHGGSRRLGFIGERCVIYFDGAEWHLDRL